MKRGSRRDREAGVTLVELAITLSMIAIVAVLALPSMSGFTFRIALKSDTATMANSIALARASAIAKNNDFHIIFSPAGDSYTLRNETTGMSFATNTVSRKVDLYSVQGLDSPNTLAIRPVGNVGRLDGGTGNYEDLPLGTDAVISLKTRDDVYYKRVVVETAGRVYVERSANGASWVED